MKNSLGIEIPEYIEGIGNLEPFQGAWTKLNKGWMGEQTTPPPVKASQPHFNKMCETLEEAILKCNPHNGMTVSFHHHLRGGDYLLIRTIEILDKLGIKDITLASSSLTTAHDGLVPYLKNGVITKIFSSGIRGKLGEAISYGILKTPVIIHSHGGRVRAIQTGKIRIDLAIIATSAADVEGNATGSHGKSAFGSIGYAMIDAWYAARVVVVSDSMVEYPCVPPSIRQNYVDYVVNIDTIGDASKIASGTTRITKSPLDLRIAQLAAEAIVKSGHFNNGFSFQVGAGGASLAVAKFVRKEMVKQNIKGSFLLGGVTSVLVEMLEEGLFKSIFDVQSFDAAVSSSILNNTYHIEIPSGLYANPYNCGCMTNKLDVVVLGALEIDTDFNVNVMTGNDGTIRGASGGHSDTASGAQLTVVVCPSFRGRIPIVKKEVHNIVTPGESVDVLVTERGICVHPNRPELEARLIEAGLNIRKIEDLAVEVERFTGTPKPLELLDKIVGLIEYRDGTIIDVIKQTKGDLEALYEEFNI
ncbi:MAG: citrate lyase subunit alpha [Bacteroidales bacterium]|nr:citrate lyase subunit alpha [Bacteroidales bacterium]